MAGWRVSTWGMITVTDSTIADNSAFIVGGGSVNRGTMTITATITDNPGRLGRRHLQRWTIYAIGSTIADNIGGGIDSSTKPLTVTDSTIADNSAGGNGDGGGRDGPRLRHQRHHRRTIASLRLW